MAARAEVVFVSTGGAIPGHDERTHREFWERVSASDLAPRFVDCGRLPRREALATLDSCHVVLCISRRCLEAELGSRQRLVEAMAHGRPVIVTEIGDLPTILAQAGAGIAIPPEDPAALAAAIVRLAGDREGLEVRSREARRLWEQRWTYAATTAPLQTWTLHPERWPPSVLGEQRVSELAAERFRLLSELEQLRGSRTLRALRLLDRFLGRGSRS
jgi:glycosyltransferase involved in cell wall biosynthesis